MSTRARLQLGHAQQSEQSRGAVQHGEGFPALFAIETKDAADAGARAHMAARLKIDEHCQLSALEAELTSSGARINSPNLRFTWRFQSVP